MTFPANVDTTSVVKSIRKDIDPKRKEIAKLNRVLANEEAILKQVNEDHAELMDGNPSMTKVKRSQKKVADQEVVCENLRKEVKALNRKIMRNHDVLLKRFAQALRQQAEKEESSLAKKLNEAMENYKACIYAQSKGRIAAFAAVETMNENMDIDNRAEDRVDAEMQRLQTEAEALLEAA